MPSSYTSSGIELIGDGEQSGTWGTTTNANLQHIDRMISQAVSITLSGTTHTLTVSDGGESDGHYAVLVFGGAPSGTNTVTISPNDAKRVYYVQNNSGETIILAQGSGTTVSVADGRGAIVYCDGAGASASVVDFTSTITPTLASLGVTASASELNILDGATLSTAELNILDGVTSTTAELNILDGATVTAAELNILDGVPALSGNGGKALAVNFGGTALEYVSFPEGTVYTAGDGITLIGTAFNHADTSTATGIATTGAEVIDTLSVDTYGHITTLTTRTLTAADIGAGDITGVTAGSGLSGGGASGNVTLSHADTSSQSSVNNSGRTFIQDISVDTYGHITSIGSASVPESGFGVSTQSLQNVLGSRSAGTTYQNGTSSPIWVGVAYYSNDNEGLQWSPNGSTWYDLADLGNGRHMPVSVVIPPGYSYRIFESTPGSVYSLTGWSEYR